MNSDRLKEFEGLLSLLLDGELSELERERLLLELRENEGLKDELLMHLEVSERLSRESASRSDARFVESAETHLLAKETEESFVNSVIARIEEEESRKWEFFSTNLPWKVGVFAAVAAMIVMTFLMFTVGGHSVQSFVPLATVSYSEGLDKAAAAAMLSNSELVGQELEIEKGIVRVELNNGASVTVEGPAAFLIETPLRFHLRKGRISAFCPPSAHGFKVLTAKADVIDLGTSFGVSTDENGDSKVVVFDGEVKVEDKADNGETRRLLKGDALQITQRKMEKVQFDGRPYRNIWPVNSGIMHTSGSVIPPSPDRLDQLMNYENDEHMIIFPERRNVKLTGEYSATKVEPGTMTLFSEIGEATFQPKKGVRYSSYLLHFNPVGERVGAGSFTRMRGAVVFNRPIVAIFARDSELEATDALFNEAEKLVLENRAKGRGLESQKGKAPDDKIFMSKGKKRLRFNLFAGPSIDEIRIVVEERKPKSLVAK